MHGIGCGLTAADTVAVCAQVTAGVVAALETVGAALTLSMRCGRGSGAHNPYTVHLEQAAGSCRPCCPPLAELWSMHHWDRIQHASHTEHAMVQVLALAGPLFPCQPAALLCSPGGPEGLQAPLA